ncbi:MAG TPA: type IV secretory system conjugative DNA transfer family protein, partial [Myxococcota bacterium]|nr:type IV secretory system conjugative DNA transfer family protein [Myxococcota bacterium]
PDALARECHRVLAPGGRVARFAGAAEVAIYTPGSRAGRPLSPLRSFAPPPPALAGDADAVRERAQTAVSGLLALLGRDADPLRSREHILLARIVTESWERGAEIDLPGMIRALEQPPFARVGALELESFYPAKERFALAGELNNLLASPAFEAWLEGDPLDIGKLLRAPDGRPRLAVLSIAHLSDAERMFFVTLLLSELVAWMRAQPGTESLRALLYMDEVFGYLPPTANPPSKVPLLTLLKQARAFGVGVVLATQNPVDLDYKALGNAGTWFLGRLQTERDRARVAEGLAAAAATAGDAGDLERQLGGLEKRVFLAKSASEDAPVLFQTRFALSYLRGPMTRDDLKKLARPASAAPAGAATPDTAPRRPAAKATLEAGPPLLPPEIPQMFLAAEGATASYRPALLAELQVHYAAPAQDLDLWERVRLLVPFDAGGAPLYAEAREIPAERGTVAAPVGGARFDSIPDEAGRPARYAAWGREIVRHVQRERPLTLSRCASLGVVSKPGETESEFRARLRERVREERDRALDALRDRYDGRLDQAKRRVAAARARAEREGEQYRDQKLQTAVSVGASVLGAIFGRRRGKLGGAAVAARAASRAVREHGDIARAEDTVRDAEAALAELEQELGAKLDELRASLAEDALVVEPLAIAPRKGDLTLDRVALAWEPVP